MKNARRDAKAQRNISLHLSVSARNKMLNMYLSKKNELYIFALCNQ